MMTTPADRSGTNFIGVWSPTLIGRINIFDPDNGGEGGDNIQAWKVGNPFCPGEGNCFDPEGNGTPGCNDRACCEAVCEIEPLCCIVEWDSICAEIAAAICGNPACPGEGSCFESNGTPGCDDPVCCNKVCQVNPFCCDVEWDQGCASEAADLCQGGPPGELIWFTNQAEFEAFNAGEGKVLKGIEDYEEANLAPGEVVGMDDPLVSGIPNPPAFPDGLTGLPNLQVQSNLSGGNPTDPNPRGANALVAFGAPAGNFVSDVVIANFFVDSLDLIFTDEKTGVGGNTLRFSAPGSLEMRVYDINNNFLGMMAAPADPAGTNFLGVWSPIPIGRVNLWSPDNGAEGLDNIQAWQEGDPCPWDLDDDGNVGVPDLLELILLWGTDPGGPPDFNGDGDVGVPDLLELILNWGACP
ncbi:MAG: hypothetical protein V3W34_04330 [Phycisphaerae bacterium]